MVRTVFAPVVAERHLARPGEQILGTVERGLYQSSRTDYAATYVIGDETRTHRWVRGLAARTDGTILAALWRRRSQKGKRGHGHAWHNGRAMKRARCR